ncbi:MAG: hypothetical protein ACIAS6_09485, partial [Phycisphaerales bacterium JB060]
MPDRTRILLFATLFVLLAASPALANAGSVAMLAGAAHLLVGNLAIGLAEGGILMKLGARRRAMGLAIAANYLSAWAGVLLAAWAWGVAMDALPGDYLSKIIPAHWLVFAAFTLVGFVIELPILWLAFDTPRKPRRVLAAIALANAATALGLVVWYGAASDVSLASRFDSVKEPAMVELDGTREAKTDDGQGGALPWVYYIASDGQTVRRIRLDGSDDARVTKLPEAIERGWLHGGLRHDGGVDLLVRAHEFKELGQSQDWSHISYQGAYDVNFIVVEEVGAAASAYSIHGMAIAAPLDASQERIENTIANVEALRITADGQRTRRYALSTPFVFYTGPMYASRLPGNVLVFQVGWHMGNNSRGIYVASLDTMR